MFRKIAGIIMMLPMAIVLIVGIVGIIKSAIDLDFYFLGGLGVLFLVLGSCIWGIYLFKGKY